MEYFFSIIAITLALLLATGGEAWTETRGGCSAPSSVAMSRIITSIYNDSGLRIGIIENEIVCNSYAYEKMSVFSLYDRCNETCLPEPVSVVLDILCLDGVWELTHYERVSYSTISNESPNCTDCLDVEAFQSRRYPTNPPGSLAYNQTTHCLLLPSCYNEAGSLIGYFSARECCVEMEGSRSYRYGDRSFPCIVHGFVKTIYSVVEGETLDIAFGRNAKGITNFPLITIEGRIISEGDEDDYQPVSVTLYRRDQRITLSLTAYNDMIALEDGDKVILRHTSGINNYVNLVEQRGEFISHTTEVAIVDKNNRVEIDLAQSVYTVSEDEAGNQILTLVIKNGLTVQGTIPLRLTAMSLTSPVVNEAHKATPRQDFHVETVDIEIPPGAVGMTNISLNGIIIDDNTVENHIQRFSLMVEVSEDRVFFDSDNSTKKSAQVAIESDDTVSVSLLLSNLVFYESDESPFNICVIVTSEGTDQNCPVEFQVNYTLSFTKYSYTENGDDETIFRDVTVDKCDNMTCVNLKAVFNVQNDEEFNLQLFNVSLLPNAETDIPQSRMIRVFTDVVKFEIRDDDLLQIRLENREHYVFESTSAVNICLVIGGDEDCPINAIYYYRVHTYGGNASAFEDYRPFNSLNVFQVCKERNCFQIDILDSSPLHEDVEYFEFILTIENDVVPFAELVDAQGRVFIIPKPTVNLMAESFTGSEADEKVKVCASLSNYDTRYNISVLINVVPTLWENPQSADYDDFSNETLEMRFNSNEACVDIKLIDDNMVELQYGYFRESFRVTLESPDNNVRLGEVISARVYIIDDDYTRVELDRDLTNFTVREGSSDPARVCASVVDPLDPVCPIQFPAGIVFLSESYSAVPPGDFRAISALRAIKQCDHTVCVDMVYHDDNIVETDEVFQVYITNSPGLDPNIRFDRTRYDITIMDNDVVTIGPDHVNIDVNESVGVVEVCIVAEDGLDEDCPVGFPLNLTLLISEDYTESLVFGECDELYQCLVLSIIDDDRVEEEEQLSIILKNTYERDNVLLRNGTLTVIDDDEAVVGLERLVYSVYEDDEEVEICVTVYSPTTDCPIAFPFEVVFEANPDTAFPGSDYRLVDGFYMFGKCQTRICFLPVDIINNDLMEDTEMFSVTLQLGFSDNINITPNVATVTIMDKDVLIVSFDKAVYDVQETSRNLTVCVEVTSPNVSCPVKTSFSLSFFILGYTAINPEDFVAEFYTAIEFTPCSKRWCAPPITIVNDQQLEQEELFDLILLSDNPELVTPHPSHAIVNIHDDGEMAEVQLQTTAYTVTEVVNDSVSICAVVSRPANGDCPITFECTLNLSVGGDNYPMVLWPCQRQQCVHVPIKNDYQVEMTETLLIRLERSESLDSRILINSSGSLTIYDDPSDNSTVGLESVRYIGLEGEAVEICATVKNPANMDCPIKFEFSLIVSTADDTAVFADDYEEFRSNLTFSTCEMRRCISISTVPDGCIVEELEEFIILLNMVVGEGPLDRIHLEPAEGRVAIVDNDVAYVRFINNTDVVVNEGGGSVLLFLAMTDEDGLMTCSCEFEFSVTVLTRQGTAERDRDYRQIFPMVVFSGELIKPVMVTIIEDETVEELNEDFTVTVARSVGQPANVIPVNIPARITIRDDDNATFGLEKASVSVVEDLTFRVCVVLKSMKENCSVDFPFYLILAVFGVATSEDHDAFTTNITFGECSRRECTYITVFDDMSLERQEPFSLSLLRLPGNDRILLDVVEKVVTIFDTDSITIDFDDPGVVVESYALEVCLIIEGAPTSACPSSVPLRVILQTFDGTALAGSDYERTVNIQIIPECATRICMEISTIDDNTLENIEYFSVLLSHGANIDLDSRINISNPEKQYAIFDIDTAIVSFRSHSHVVAETDEVAQLCVTVRPASGGGGCPVDYSFTVSIIKMDITADAGDYEKSPITVTFPRCGTEQCTDIPIFYSCDMEPDESFRAILQGEHISARIIIDDRDLIVNITDSDALEVKLEHTVYRVEENDSLVEVCATLHPPNYKPAMPFRVHIRTLSNSAGLQEDFTPISTYLRFSSTVTKQCITISISDDTLTEFPEEFFTVALERAENTPDRVLLTCNKADIIIIDNDDATVEFESLTYTVNENAGQVEVCVAVTSQNYNCPVAHDFSLVFGNEEYSAGRRYDYVDEDANGTLQIEACQQRQCFSVGIVDSDQLEEEESFDISLFRNGLHNNIHIGPQSFTTVTIRDDDTVEVGLTQTNYRVEEGGTLTEIVCAKVFGENGECIVPLPFFVVFTTSDGRADSPEDYTALTQAERRFSPCISQVCIELETINDGLVEGDENMFVSLTTGNNWDSRLSLNRTNAQVTIEDDDYVTIGLQRTDYTFSSTAEKVEVCVYMSNSSGSQTNCPIGFPVDIFFNFTEAVFEVDSAQELSAGEGIEKVGETALKLQFEMCQSEFCFDISQRNVTREDRGRFEIFLAATPEYGRIIVLDPEKTRGYIEIR